MTVITDFVCYTPEGFRVPSDAHGNNVAFKCPECGYPILAVMRPHQRGSSADKPSACRSCNAAYWLEIIEGQKRLITHQLVAGKYGRYVRGKSAKPTASQNIASWSVIDAMLNAYGSVEYYDLVAAVKQHDHVAGSESFIQYCINNGWLKGA